MGRIYIYDLVLLWSPSDSFVWLGLSGISVENVLYSLSFKCAHNKNRKMKRV